LLSGQPQHVLLVRALRDGANARHRRPRARADCTRSYGGENTNRPEGASELRGEAERSADKDCEAGHRSLAHLRLQRTADYGSSIDGRAGKIRELRLIRV